MFSPCRCVSSLSPPWRISEPHACVARVPGRAGLEVRSVTLRGLISMTCRSGSRREACGYPAGPSPIAIVRIGSSCAASSLRFGDEIVEGFVEVLDPDMRSVSRSYRSPICGKVPSELMIR